MIHYSLISSLGKYHLSSTGEYNFCCPFCAKRVRRPDTGFHLYVNPSKYMHGIRGWFHCHRCKARGPITRLIKQVEKVPVTRWEKFREGLMSKFCEPTEKKKVSLPEDYVEIIKGTQAYDYLVSRGISDGQILSYKIGFGTKDLREVPEEERGRFAGSGRIIFPDFDADGNCVYWVARSYKGHKIKYKNPAGSNAGDRIYNLYGAIRYQTCVVTEGVISAIAAGYNGVATYGKDVTTFQIALLANAGFRHYFIAHDGDARAEALDVAEKLARRHCSVSLVCFGKYEDPASVADIRDKISRSLSLTTSNKLKFKLGLT